MGDLITLVPFFSLLVAVISFVVANNRQGKKDIEERIANDTRLNTKIDYLIGNSNEMKSEIKGMSERIASHDLKFATLDSSLKSAHHRIDGLEKRLDGKE